MKLTRLAMAMALLALATACGKKEEPVMPATANAPLETQAPPPAAALSTADKTALASLPAPYSTADPENGKRKFGQCRSCHMASPTGSALVGPNLWGVYGRKAGSQAGFAYSAGLKAAGWTWDAARLDAWIKNPRAVLPDTKMSFLGVKSDKDRADIVAYLRLQGGK